MIRKVRTLFELGSPAALTDGQLLERFATRRGDASERAFKALVDRHGPMVLRACRGILRDDHESLDAFQATFLVLARKGRSLWVGDSLGPWLHRVACRAASKARARAGRRRELGRRLAESGPGSSATPDDPDRSAILHDELDRLPARYRAAIVLCDLQGHSAEEASGRLGCPVGTIGSRLSRGRKLLRERLTRRGLAPTPGLAWGAVGAPVPGEIAAGLVRAARILAEEGATAGAPSASVAGLAGDVSRSLIMTKVRAVVAALAVAGVLLPVAGRGFSAPGRADGEPAAKAGDDDRIKDGDWITMPIAGFPDNTSLHPKSDDPVRANDFIRIAALMKDGTVQLRRAVIGEYDFLKERVAPPMRHATPIRGCDFVAEARLLFTVSDDTVKLWDGVTGEFRREIPGQVVSPAHHSPNDRTGRFQTIDLAGRVVTTWDGKSMEPASTFEFLGPKLVGAFQSEDGRTLATVAEDGSVTLRHASDGKPIATLAPGSTLARMVFDDKAKRPKRFGVDRAFWIGARHLLPGGTGSAPKP